MEELLHYVWKHKVFPLEGLKTTDGVRVEVIDTGLANPHAGPDFFNAKLKLGDTLWVGNVEVHRLASDWLRHGHQHDAAYDNVILHVVEQADVAICRTDGKPIPQLVLTCPDSVRCHYDELRTTDLFPPCYSVLSTLPRLTVHSWLSALTVERFERKAGDIRQRLARCQNHWEDVFFITLARNFGFGLNSDAFEAWAWRLPLRAVDKHRDNLLQVEALFFGTAGLLDLPSSTPPDAYLASLQREYSYLSHKFSLTPPADQPQWHFLRLRPSGFPHVRIAQLAYLYHTRQSLFSRMMEATDTDTLYTLLDLHTSPYWEEHYRFGTPSPHRTKSLGKGSRNLILINTIIPFLYAYGLHKAQPALCERATRLLESLPAEDNSILRQWSQAGIEAHTAADSQAILQLHRTYCERRDCLRCRFGYEYLKKSKLH